MEEKGKTERMKEKAKRLEEEMKELKAIELRYYEEVNEHQRINTENLILKKQLTDMQKAHASFSFDRPITDFDFYNSLRDMFLNYLSLYLQELQQKNLQVFALKESEETLK